MTLTRNAKAFALASALLTSAFSGTSLQVTALGAGGVVLLAGEAIANTTIPDVGTVVKRKPGDASIAKGVSDDNGEVVFKLEPGEYTATVGQNRPQDFTIGRGKTGIKVVVTGTKEEYVGHATLLR